MVTVVTKTLIKTTKTVMVKLFASEMS